MEQLITQKMVNFIFISITTFGMLFSLTPSNCFGKNKSKYALAVHGGAVSIPERNATIKDRKMFKEYRLKLTEALKVGDSVLKNGGTSLDAVEAAVRVLEDSPLFNAGKGAVFNSDGKNELDACIMDGKTLQGGAVANTTVVKNPITAARRVMTKTKHVLLCADGADTFAKQQNLEIVDPSYFHTDHEWKRYQKLKNTTSSNTSNKYGTVGAVALDIYGNLAAATSSGGLPNKKFGRIGDCPIIGAGTYANNNTCAVSATGIGEFFIRNVVAYDISALMEYSGLSLEKAAEKVIKVKLKKQRGYGGVIAMDKEGNIAMPFYLYGMKRGFINSNGDLKVYIY